MLAVPPAPERLRRAVLGPFLGERRSRRPEDFDGPAGDPGLFGPGSAVWEVHSRLATFVFAGPAAFVLQALHPKVAAGVADHSRYREDPFGRAERTGEYIAVTTYGNTAAAEAAVAQLTRVHRRVRGVTPGGEPYDANDPELTTYVNTTEAYALLKARRRYGLPGLSRRDADRYVDEMADLAARLGGASPPRTLPAVHRYLDDMRSALVLTDQGRDIASFVLTPAPGTPAAARPVQEFLVQASLGLLPSWVPPLLGRFHLGAAELATRPTVAALATWLDWLAGPSPQQQAAWRRVRT